MSIRSEAIRRLRAGLGVLAFLAAAPALAVTYDVPQAYGTNNNCASCHEHPPGHPGASDAMPNIGDNTRLDTTAHFKSFLTGGSSPSPSMVTLGNTLSNAELDSIRTYLVRVRDGDLELNSGHGPSDPPGDTSRTFTFPTPVYSTEVSPETLTIQFTNLRGYAPTITASISGTLPGSNWFTITGDTCTPAAVGAATDAGTFGSIERLTVQSCQITVKFTPKGSLSGPTTNYSMTFTANWGATQLPSTATHTITLHGTSLGPRVPVYSPSGFGALSVPGFSAATDSSQTQCPTISNPGSASLQLAFSAIASGAPNYTSYYEIASTAACPVVPAFPACVAASASITGSTTLVAGSACTLPIRFNPGKFGFAGGTGARAAQLVVTHNDPVPGTMATSLLLGNVTSGPEPAIGLSPNPSVNGAGEVLPPAFAAQIIHTTSVAWDLPVFNSGTADGLDLTSVTSSNPEFALTEDCVAAAPLAIVVGTNPHCTVSLRYTPNATVKSCTMLTIQAAFSSNGIQVLKVCGTGIPVPAPQTSLSRTSIDFGRRSIGGVYKPEPVVVTNLASATADLTLSAIGIAGAGFAIVADPTVTVCMVGTSLPPGSSCTLPIQFTPGPTPDTAYAATLTISSNDPATPNPTVSLAAFAIAAAAPVLQWTGAPAKLVFTSPTLAGQQSAETLTVRLTDVGPGAVDLASLRVVGTDASSFSLGICPATLYQDEFCDVAVYFLPGSGGVKTAQIEVTSATGVVPALLPVEGTAIGGVSAYLQTSTAALAFGDVRVGTQSQPLQVRLTAFGGVVRVTAMDVAAPYSIQSTTCPALPFILQLGSDCTVFVSFAPSATTSAPASLSISTDAGPAAVQVSLDGTGTADADVSGGGCSIASGDSLTDPSLWLLAALAALALAWRRRSAHRGRSGRP